MSVEKFGERVRAARIAAGYGDSYRKAGEALQEAEEAGFGKAVHFNTIREHEIMPDTMPGGDVAVCYGAAFHVNPIWLIAGTGPREWDAGVYEKDSAEQFAAEVRKVARWMLDLSGDEGRFREIVAGYDEPTLEKLAEEGGAGDVGTPQQELG